MNEKNLFSTDSDCPVQIELYASIDIRKRLVVEYKCDYDNSPQRDFERRAIVDREDTELMAGHYRVSIEQLPTAIYERCGYGVGSSATEADAVFKSALDMILDSGGHYRLEEF